MNVEDNNKGSCHNSKDEIDASAAGRAGRPFYFTWEPKKDSYRNEYSKPP